LQGTFRHPRDSFSTGQVQLHLASTQVQLAQFQTLQKERPGLAGIVSATRMFAGDLRQAGSETKIHVVGRQCGREGHRGSRSRTKKLWRPGRNRAHHRRGCERTSGFPISRIEYPGHQPNPPGGRLSNDRRRETSVDCQIEKAWTSRSCALKSRDRYPFGARHASGTLDDPRANMTFDLTRAKVYDEPNRWLQDPSITPINW